MSNPTSNTAEHDEIMAMLPWFVNKTLEGPQRSVVSNHVEHCADCQREIQFLTILNQSVQEDTRNSYSTNADVDKSLASVMDRIDGKSPQRSLVTSAVSSIQQKLGQIFQFATDLSPPQWGATALAGVLVAILGFQFYNVQLDDNYTVLSSSAPESTKMRLSVVMTSSGNDDQVQAIIQSEVEKLKQSIDLQVNSDGAYIVTFNDSIGVSELSKLVVTLENTMLIERVEVLP